MMHEDGALDAGAIPPDVEWENRRCEEFSKIFWFLILAAAALVFAAITFEKCLDTDSKDGSSCKMMRIDAV